MKASIEVLSGLIRVGPETDAYGKPYEYAVAFSSTDGKTAVLKGLVTDGGLTLAHAAAMRRALRAIGLDFTWERVTDASEQS